MYTSKIVEKIKNENGWDYTKVGIFQENKKIFEFIFNYPTFREEQFFPFEQEGRWYAFYTPNYYSIGLLSLPDCTPIKVNCPELEKFCTVEFYIPKSESENKFLGICILCGCFWGGPYQLKILDIEEFINGNIKLLNKNINFNSPNEKIKNLLKNNFFETDNEWIPIVSECYFNIKTGEVIN